MNLSFAESYLHELFYHERHNCPFKCSGRLQDKFIDTVKLLAEAPSIGCISRCRCFDLWLRPAEPGWLSARVDDKHRLEAIFHETAGHLSIMAFRHRPSRTL
jgi:hypothetical protein